MATSPPTPRSNRAAPLDPWALAALLVALLLGWCPLGGVAGLILGIVALRSIRRADRPRRGAGMAWGAIFVSATLLLSFGLWAERFIGGLQDDMELQAIQSIEATLRGQPESADGWAPGTPGGAPDPIAIAEFARPLAARLGDLRRATITNRMADGMVDPRITIAFNADFAKGTAFGKAVFRPVPGTIPPTLRLEAFEVESGGTRLSLPAPTKENP